MWRIPPHHGRLPWEDGRSTAGAAVGTSQAQRAFAARWRVARQLGKRILSALTGARVHLSGDPLKIFPPLFNRYAAADGTISACTSTMR